MFNNHYIDGEKYDLFIHSVKFLIKEFLSFSLCILLFSLKAKLSI